jgi:hypothetical protein
MLGVRLVRPTATRALAFTVLLASYGGGTFAIAGIAATTAASTAFARSNSNRGFSPSYGVGNRMSTAGSVRSGSNYSSGNNRSYGPRYGVGNQMSGAPKPSKTYMSGAPKPPKTGRPVTGQSYSRTIPASSSPTGGNVGEIRTAGPSFGGRGPVYGDTGPRGSVAYAGASGGTVGRGAAIEACAQRYRSYDRATMTYTDPNGRRRSCP